MTCDSTRSIYLILYQILVETIINMPTRSHWLIETASVYPRHQNDQFD